MGGDASGQVNLALTSDQALVLFEWVARFNETSHEFADQAEQRVLWDIEAMLESALLVPLSPDYKKLVQEARTRLRDSSD